MRAAMLSINVSTGMVLYTFKIYIFAAVHVFGNHRMRHNQSQISACHFSDAVFRQQFIGMQC